MHTASACAKLILCGEHAVVYGRPALALPVAGVRAHTRLVPRTRGGLAINAADVRRRWLVNAESDHPLSELVLATLAHLGVARQPDARIVIRSAIPQASGMGSGAAVATALVRVLAAALGRSLPPAEVSALVYASERRFHGTPSGIDNTVIAYEQPIWFVRPTEDGRRKTEDGGQTSVFRLPSSVPSAAPLIEPINIATSFTLLIGDSGVRSATRLPVGELRRRWQATPAAYETLFDQIGALAANVRVALASGNLAALGAALNANHALLGQCGVSSPELDALVAAAQAAGAQGAKLSGAGWGGVMLALVDETSCAPVRQALLAAGATRVLETVVQPNHM